MSNIVLVAAVSYNNVIGNNNQLPWKMPSDLAHFKKLTLGKVVVMGRKTFESIGRPLPDRVNIVISTQPCPAQHGDQVIWVNSVEHALRVCELNYKGVEVMVIGGGDIYNQFMPLADMLIITRIEAEVEGDTQFPKINPAEFSLNAGYSLPTGPGDSHTANVEIWEPNVVPTAH